MICLIMCINKIRIEYSQIKKCKVYVRWNAQKIPEEYKGRISLYDFRRLLKYKIELYINDKLHEIKYIEDISKDSIEVDYLEHTMNGENNFETNEITNRQVSFDKVYCKSNDKLRAKIYITSKLNDDEWNVDEKIVTAQTDEIIIKFENTYKIFPGYFWYPVDENNNRKTDYFLTTDNPHNMFFGDVTDTKKECDRREECKGFIFFRGPENVDINMGYLLKETPPNEMNEIHKDIYNQYDTYKKN